MEEYARLWAATPKIVFSSTLDSVEGNARLVRGDIADELAKLRREFDGDLAVGGATLASSFIRAGLVDEYRLVVHPVVIGQGTPFFPKLDRQRSFARSIPSDSSRAPCTWPTPLA